MKLVGEVFNTNNYGSLTVIDYKSAKKVKVRFDKTGYETTVPLQHIKLGNVKDRLHPNVYGVGITGDEIINIKSVAPKEYKIWVRMLERCYDEKYHNKSPTYKDCETSENFKYFPYFMSWCNKQVGFHYKDGNGRNFQLDKDLLLKGNKVYSEINCVFIPQEINSLLTKCNSTRGKYLIGVFYDNKMGKMSACLRKNGRNVSLGYFDTEIEAFQAYKTAKEDYIKDVANKWKDQIDPRAYEALMNYQVEITD